MKQDRSKSIENNEIPAFIKKVRERIETSIQQINCEHKAEEAEWRIFLEEAIYYYIIYEDQTNTYNMTNYSEFKELFKKSGEAVYNKNYIESTYNSQYNTYYVQLQNIMKLFSVSFEEIFHKKSGFQLNNKQYRFIYELLARRNQIFVWKMILKNYNFSYNGFLDLYYKLNDADREPLINELRFIVDGLTGVKEPSGLAVNEFKNHLLAVTQLPLIEIANLPREIIQINMQEVLQHPKSPELLEFYNQNIIKLNQEIKNTIDWANMQWLSTYDDYQKYGGIMMIQKDENGNTIFGLDHVEKDEINPVADELLERLLECLKKVDSRYSKAATLVEFYTIDNKIKAEQTTTENKKLDSKVSKAFKEFYHSLTNDEKMIINSILG